MQSFQNLPKFIPVAQQELYADLLVSSEEKEAFATKLAELEGVIKGMPVSYQTESQGDDAMVQLHYFDSDSEWFITEKDMEGDGTCEATGLTVIDKQPHLGYISIESLVKTPGVEIDLHWKPKTLAEVKEGFGQ